MSDQVPFRPRTAVRSALLIAAIVVIGGGLAAWKYAAEGEAQAAAANQPEPVEVVTEAVVVPREHQGGATSIGTVLAMRSITLRNEIAGTVARARLTPGRIVEAGEVLVALDVSVEEAELHALQARAGLAETTLARMQRMADRRAVSAMELDDARAQRDVVLAEVERTRAIIARKTIRAPFRARIGIADVHIGQYLDAGSVLTTLQGVADAAHVDFAVAQSVAAGLAAGMEVEVFADDGGSPVVARIVAVDARIDPATRNATIRARIDAAGEEFAPGASVRVRVPVGTPALAVAVPVSALRKGPGGDHVFVLESDDAGRTRAHLRPVEAGPVVGDEVLILSGLTSGEHVASSGSFKLREAVLVTVTAGATASAGESR